jgi:hypothetical protein
MRAFRGKITALMAIGAAVISAGCDYDTLTMRVKRTAPEQWYTWACDVIAYSKTNATAMPRSQWPTFVKEVTAGIDGPWHLVVQQQSPSSEPYVMLMNPGGFQGMGVDFGSSSSFTETETEGNKIVRIHPGVYVHRTM